MNTLSCIVYDCVHMLSRSHSTIVSDLLSDVKKRVDHDVLVYKPDNEDTVELVDTSHDNTLKNSA